MRVRTILACVAAAALCLILVGCTSYYKVTDTTSGRTYYTTGVDHQRQSSAVRFEDERTHSQVTLQSSEVKEVSEADFEAGVAGK